jgi:hypothetical protein
MKKEKEQEEEQIVKTTPCECPLSKYGIFCERHKINKTAHFQKLCATRSDYFEMYENCAGPGQEFTNCDGQTVAAPFIPIEVPEGAKEGCPSCKKDQDKDAQTANVVKDKKEQKKDIKLPSLWEQAKNLTKATVAHVKSGMAEVSPEVKKERLDICEGCEFFLREQNRCKACGCHLLTKSRWKTSACPKGYWGPVE